jgi:hypothetical protein
MSDSQIEAYITLVALRKHPVLVRKRKGKLNM